jgi:chemotaxis protein MotB
MHPRPRQQPRQEPSHMAGADAAKRPIIVIKKKGGHGGHHGGAWKVAYADFVTAMMALFIVLWLMNSSKQIQVAVGGYFKDPTGTSKKVGSNQIGSGENFTLTKDNMPKLKEELQKAVRQITNFDKLKNQIEMTITSEGLRIELLESSSGTFFESGKPGLNDDGRELLVALAEQLGKLPNHISIEGHTDAKPYTANRDYGNWELSSDRANAARRLMQAAGLRSDQISQVRGYADQKPRVPGNPFEPSNRRISLIVQYVVKNDDEESTPIPGAELDAKGAASRPPESQENKPEEHQEAKH